MHWLACELKGDIRRLLWQPRPAVSTSGQSAVTKQCEMSSVIPKNNDIETMMTYFVQGRVLDLWNTRGPSDLAVYPPPLHPTSVPCATTETLSMWMGSSGFPIKSELYFSLFLNLWFITSKLSVVRLDVKPVQKSLKPAFCLPSLQSRWAIYLCSFYWGSSSQQVLDFVKSLK